MFETIKQTMIDDGVPADDAERLAEKVFWQLVHNQWALPQYR